MRWLWGLGGALLLAIGIAVLLVPVVPTSPFLILAAACWMRASPRLERWLVEHRLLGAPIRDWRAGRGVRFGIKLTFLVLTALGMGLAQWTLRDEALWLRGAVLLGGLFAAWFILSLPSRTGE